MALNFAGRTAPPVPAGRPPRLRRKVGDGKARCVCGAAWLRPATGEKKRARSLPLLPLAVIRDEGGIEGVGAFTRGAMEHGHSTELFDRGVRDETVPLFLVKFRVLVGPKLGAQRGSDSLGHRHD